MSRREAEQQPPRFPGVLRLILDVGSWAGGWWTIVSEVQRPEIREAVLLFAGAVIGVPGLAVGASSVAGAIRARVGTGDSSSSSPRPVSSADSST